MRLSRLRLQRFRNLGDQELRVPAEGMAVVGPNAQGKSNFLEAIYYLETFRSFRRARDPQLIAFGEESFRIAAHLESCNGRPDETREAVEITAAYQRPGKRKKVTVGGAEPPRLADALGGLSAVIFSPLDVGLVSDGPGERRRFLDIVLSLNVPGYLEVLQRFRHALAQRNAALRTGGAGPLVRAWDDGLVEAGAQVMCARRSWAERWADDFARYYRTVSGGEVVSVSYVPSFAVERWDPQEVAGLYHKALEESAAREARTRATGVGPHRDDLRLALVGEDEDIDLRDFGSGGQRRTAALALRLAEAATIRESRGMEPLVLLDDAFAELDEGRSERVLELFDREGSGQVILTAPKESDVRVRWDALPRWTIDRGRIRA